MVQRQVAPEGVQKAPLDPASAAGHRGAGSLILSSTKPLHHLGGGVELRPSVRSLQGQAMFAWLLEELCDRYAVRCTAVLRSTSLSARPRRLRQLPARLDHHQLLLLLLLQALSVGTLKQLPQHRIPA